jgi:glycosyltransferase involved in cell wall biosynthesis
MYPSPETPSYGVFIENHVRKMEADHGIRFELLVSPTKPDDARGRLLKYAEIYASLLPKLFRPFDLVHLHYPSPVFAPVALPPALLRNKPLVITSHGGDINMPPLTGAKRILVSQILKRADAVIAVSKDIARLLDVLGVPADRMQVIDMGCDLSLFTYALGDEKRRLKQELSLDPDRAAILFVGELIPRKGGDLFLDALSKLPEARASTILIAGDGVERNNLEAHPLAPKVNFLGAMPQRRLAKYFAAADVFVFPTRNEPLGLVTLEAMASGAAVVASRVGGVPEIVEHEKNGLLFEPERVDQISHHLARVLRDRELRERLARAGLETAKAHSLDRQVSRIVDIYKSLV